MTIELAAASLFYADWTHPPGDRFARAVDAVRRYRHLFPLPSPRGTWADRD